MGVIRKKNQLEVSLERIEDPYAREALSNLVSYVNEMGASGVSTAGQVRCENLRFGDSPSFKAQLFSGVLASSANDGQVILKVPGIYVGLIGFTQIAGQSAFVPLQQAAAAIINFDRAYIFVGDAAEGVLIMNTGDHPVRYRAMLFYTDEDL